MAARPRTLPAAVAPVLVGTAAAVEASDDLRVGAFIAALVGSIFIQIGTNLANDYSDAKRGADTVDRLGPVRVTAQGLVAPRRVLVATGAWTVLTTGSPVLSTAVVVFDCRIIEVRAVASHNVFFGAVEAVRLGPAGPALGPAAPAFLHTLSGGREEA